MHRPTIRRYTIGISSIVILYTFVHAINLSFDQQLFLGSNSGMQHNYNNSYFQYGNNTLGGVIFRKSTQTVSPTTITLGAQQITGCTQQIRGAYYNPARGNRLRPLDAQTLNEFETVDPSYLALGLNTNKGFFTNCQGNPHAIYGHIHHTRSGSTHFHLLAGATVNTSNNTYSNTLDDNLTINTTTLTAHGYIFDSLGGVAQIGSAPICGNQVIEAGEMCDDGNTNNGDGCSNTCQIEQSRTCTGQPSVCTQTVVNQGSGGFNGRLQFASLYTNNPLVQGLIYVTEPAGYIIQGNTQSTVAGTINTTTTGTILLTTGEGVKTLQTTFTSIQSGIVVTGTTQITLDTLQPNLTITAPISGAIITGGTITATRTAQDTNGIATRTVQIQQGNTTLYSNTPTTNTITTTLADGLYTLTVIVHDPAGNSTTQSTSFTMQNSTIPSNRSITGFNSISGANLNTLYTSNPIIIAGLGTGVQVTGTINTGVLLKNGLDVGTQALFQNGDILRITLRSSQQYNATQTAQLTIHNNTVPFVIQTKTQDNDPFTQNNSCLSTNTYALIFLALRQSYENDTRFNNVLALMLTMIQDQIILGSNQGQSQSLYALQCFADIIQNYITTANTTQNNTNTLVYTAPNGKQYSIQYLPEIDGYTSAQFQSRKIFATYDILTRHIDANNPKQNTRNHIVDSSFTPVIYTAPNGKRYTIQKTNKGFMSYQFVVAGYFSSLERTKAHINRHNPK